MIETESPNPKPKRSKTSAAADFQLIQQGRMPAADCLDHHGSPCWKLDSLLGWLAIPRETFVAMLPVKPEGRKQRGGPDYFRSSAP